MKGVLIILALVSSAFAATKVNNCRPKSGYIQDDVDISICQGEPDLCKLPKKSKVEVSILFTPEEDVETLKTNVYAEIASVPLPFIGVDGTNVCTKLFTADGSAQASCPLKAGEKYLYKDFFNVLQVYPKVKVRVHWALRDAKTRKNIACFEIPAEITAS